MQDQTQLLLRFQAIMVSRFVEKARATYQLSLSPPSFFSQGPGKAKAWAMMDNDIHQLRQINAS
eukprot:scaffold225279_cov43-Prasinocladus_malaysianus.AAC.1